MIIWKESVDYEWKGVFYDENLLDLFAGLWIQVVVDLSPMGKHEHFEVSKLKHELGRIRVLLSFLHFSDVEGKSPLVSLEIPLIDLVLLHACLDSFMCYDLLLP